MKTETIRSKLNELDRQYEQTLAQLNALAGARQVLRGLLDEADDDTEEKDA